MLANVAPKPQTHTPAAIPHGYFVVSFINSDCPLAKILLMDWIIERVDSNEEAVYLKKPLLGIARKICVPGAFDAFIDHGQLVIRATTGFVWEVEPTSGRRRRRACSLEPV
ncbi:MAG: hypothetical protein LRY23_01550 [Burkholderiaceae bacterium]|nr:hypothetical protein [Burkholderiaceae bacterium]